MSYEGKSEWLVLPDQGNAIVVQEYMGLRPNVALSISPREYAKVQKHLFDARDDCCLQKMEFTK